MTQTRIESLEECVYMLEVTANCCYSAFEKKDQKGRNLLLKSRDKINKLLYDEFQNANKPKYSKKNDNINRRRN